MKYIMSALVFGALVVGCNRLEGQFNVTSDLTLKNSQGENQSIKVGTYTADLDKKTLSKKIVLRLNNDNNQKYEFKIPDGAKIPENGNFNLKSSDIGQAVDLAGVVTTKVTESQVREEFQSCTYTEPYVVCSAGPNGQQVCNTYMRTVTGSQWTRYYDRFIDQNIHMSVLPAGTTASSAEFTGDVSNVQRIVVNQSPCH